MCLIYHVTRVRGERPRVLRGLHFLCIWRWRPWRERWACWGSAPLETPSALRMVRATGGEGQDNTWHDSPPTLHPGVIACGGWEIQTWAPARECSRTFSVVLGAAGVALGRALGRDDRASPCLGAGERARVTASTPRLRSSATRCSDRPSPGHCPEPPPSWSLTDGHNLHWPVLLWFKRWH